MSSQDVKVPLGDQEVIDRRSIQHMVSDWIANEGPHAIWSACTSAGRYLKIVFEKYHISLSVYEDMEAEEVLLYKRRLIHATKTVDTTYMLQALGREGYKIA